MMEREALLALCDYWHDQEMYAERALLYAREQRDLFLTKLESLGQKAVEGVVEAVDVPQVPGDRHFTLIIGGDDAS